MIKKEIEHAAGVCHFCEQARSQSNNDDSQMKWIFQSEADFVQQMVSNVAVELVVTECVAYQSTDTAPVQWQKILDMRDNQGVEKVKLTEYERLLIPSAKILDCSSLTEITFHLFWLRTFTQSICHTRSQQIFFIFAKEFFHFLLARLISYGLM